MWKLIGLLVMLAIASASGATAQVQHCDNYTGVLPRLIEKPYGAVGYIGNGCTATLIGPQHILTAAHCIVNEGDSSNWYRNIWFYPNYHKGDSNPPRFRIDRAVVGAHGYTGGYYYTSDWAIARLATPATGFPYINMIHSAFQERPVKVLHYTRDGIGSIPNPKCSDPPYNDELGCTPGWRNWFGNAWWQDGLESNGTVSIDSEKGYSITSAPGLGGSSGSSHLMPYYGSWVIVGVTHGGPPCLGADGPWANRFYRAPWFAANVAVASAPSSPDRTGVFVLDSDRKDLVYRERTSTGSSDPFLSYRWAKELPSGQFTRISAFKLNWSGLPGILVLSNKGELWQVDRVEHSWGNWKKIAAPSGYIVRDIDTTANKAGQNLLIAVGWNGKTANPKSGVFMKKRVVDSNVGLDWDNWLHIKSEGYRYTQVTAIRHHGDGLNQVWVLTSDGAIRTTKEAVQGWSAMSPVNAPTLDAGESIVDIDAGWDSDDRALLVALSSKGRAWTCNATSSLSTAYVWASWKVLPSKVETSKIPNEPRVEVNRGGVKLSSITASRWAETNDGVTVPVVFATDTWGNVYQTNYTKATATWCDWMPFYGKRINSSQDDSILD